MSSEINEPIRTKVHHRITKGLWEFRGRQETIWNSRVLVKDYKEFRFRLEKEEGNNIPGSKIHGRILGVGCRNVEGQESKWATNLLELGTLAS